MRDILIIMLGEIFILNRLLELIFYAKPQLLDIKNIISLVKNIIKIKSSYVFF